MSYIKQTIFAGVLNCIVLTTISGQDFESDKYLSWSVSQAESIAKPMRVSSKIGSLFDLRGLHTDRSVNYKLRATWLTPEVIRAAARLEQLKNRLTDQQTRVLVAEAEAAGDTVFLVEIDPREGSGVIPLDWRAILQPKNLRVGAEGAVSGVKSPTLRNIKGLAGVERRDYDWDIFWVTFPLVDKDKVPVFPADAYELQLVIGIYNNEGRLSWRIPESIRARTKLLSKK